MKGEYHKDEFYRETRLLRHAQAVLDRALKKISAEGLYGREAWQIYDEVREKVLALFPEKESVFNIVYWPRFSRIIWDNMLRHVDVDE